MELDDGGIADDLICRSDQGVAIVLLRLKH